MSDVTAARDAWRQFPCKIWPGAINGHGYGHYAIKGSKPQKWKLAHREALEQKLGRPILPGLFSLHHCDNPPCYEPEHLYEGTQKQNMQDMASRGRQFQQVIPHSEYPEIQRRYAAGGITHKELAAEYGVKRPAISVIIGKDPNVIRVPRPKPTWVKGDTCAVSDCTRPPEKRQWCEMHYARWRANGDPLVVKIADNYNGAPCTVDGCEAAILAQGYCSKHYQRWKKTGDPLIVLPMGRRKKPAA